MFKFSIFKIPVTVHWWFFLLAAFLGGALRAQTPEDWRGVFIFMVAAFVSILIHELGHASVGLMMGARSVSITLHGMGGVAQFPGGSFTRGKSILTTAAGPGASICLAGIFILISIFAYDPETASPQLGPLGHFIGVMIMINIFWTVFNLCPVLPLDGGQILRDLLGPNRLKLTCIIGFITLGIVGALLWIATESIYNMILIVLLGTYTWQVYRAA